jgi:hypothetical protein
MEICGRKGLEDGVADHKRNRKLQKLVHPELGAGPVGPVFLAYDSPRGDMIIENIIIRKNDI